MSYPSSIDSFAGFTSTHTLSQDNHAAQHNQEQSAIVSIENKLGTGASTPTSGTVLRGNGSGTSTYDQVHLASDVSGVLGVGNGGTGTTSTTGSGAVVLQNSPVITLNNGTGLPLATGVTGILPIANGGTNVASSNPVIQRVSFLTGAVGTTTNTFSNDDNVPQITTGAEFMSLSIVPNNSSNILEIEVTVAGCSGAGAGAQTIGCALFQDSTANALAADQFVQAVAGYTGNFKYTYVMSAGTTSLTTFRVRAGSDVAGTFTFNGAGGARKLGGVLASSIIIREYSK